MKTTAATLLILAILTTGILAGCAQESTPDSTNTSSPTKTSTMKNDSNPQLLPPAAGDTIAIIETNKGTIKAKLFAEQVPETVKNFEELAKSGNYDDVIFHRVIKNFMIQTGDFTNHNGTGGYSYKGPGTKFDDEFAKDLTHLYGTLSMANSGADTNGSQFFIVTNKAGTGHLNGAHSVFGQVYEGMEVADAIQNVKTGFQDRPEEDVKMIKVTVEPYTP